MSAVISHCGLYRYRLDRRLPQIPLHSSAILADKVVAFFGINPSTADEIKPDPTVRKWTGFCKHWGAARFIVGNVSPYRSKDVKALAGVIKWAHIERENTAHILQIMAEADVLVPCWGDRGKVPKVMHNDIDQLMAMLQTSGKPLMHFGLTKGGDPKHPLMLAYATPLTVLETP